MRELLHAFKYHRRRLLARPLADLLREAASDLLAEADAVVPVPLHPWRQWQRGFNQADDLARGLGLPVWPVLRRHRTGPPQAKLSAADRPANVLGAYQLPPASRFARHPERLSGRHLILVDDVMTTGATLDACSRVLLAAGVSRVLALTVARAVAAAHAPPRP